MEGFQWIDGNGPLEGAVVRETAILWNGVEDGWLSKATSLEATLDEGVEITAGGALDPSKLHVTATLYTGDTVEIPYDRLTVEFDNVTPGENAVTVKYQDQTATTANKVKVNAPDKTFESFTLDTKELSAHRFDEPDFSALTATVKFSGEEEGQTLSFANGDFTLSGYDTWAETGEQTVTATYTYGGEEHTDTLKFTVTEPDMSVRLEVSYNGCTTIRDGSHMQIFFKTVGIENKPKAHSMINVDLWEHAHILDYLLLNDVPASTYRTQGKLGWIAEWGESSKDNDYVLLLNWSDPAARATINKVTIKAGFQWAYTTDDKDYFPTENYSVYANLKGAVIKEDVTIWNGDFGGALPQGNNETTTPGNGWQKYASSIEATYADSEVTVGDLVNPEKITITAHYADEETATIPATAAMITNGNFNEAGTAEITVTYQDKSATFSVEVKEGAARLEELRLSVDEITVKQYETPDLSSLTVTAHYSDGSDQPVELDRCTISEMDTWTRGTKTITVEYLSVSTTFTLRVIVPDRTKGLVPVADIDKSTVFDPTQMMFYFRFEGMEAPAYKNIINIEQLQGGHIADYIEIDGVKASELFANGTLAWIGVYGGTEDGVYRLTICSAQDKKEFMANIKCVTFKEGFQWVVPSDNANHFPAPAVELYQNVPGAVVKSEVKMWNNRELGWESYVNSLNVTYNGGALPMNSVLDPATVTVTAKLYNDDDRTITATQEMFTYDFSVSGTRTVTFKYQDKTFDFNVEISDDSINGIEITTQPTTLVYKFGAVALDLGGIVVNKLITRNGETVKEPVALEDLTTKGFKPYEVGPQTITVCYGEYEATYQITVNELGADEGLIVDWNNGSQSSALENGLNVTGVKIPLINLAGGTIKANILTLDEENFVDHILINGRPAKEYVDEGSISWIGFHAWELVIACRDDRLVWSTWAGSDADLVGQAQNPACKYVEGKSEVIETVTLLRGFQVYNSKDNGDHWGTAGFVPVKVEGAVLKHDVTLVNDDGYGWIRPLAKDGDKLASDAITIKTPANKLSYVKGEELEVEGLVIHVKYEDGEEEDIKVIKGDVSGYAKDKVGEQTLTIKYADGEVTFKVTVTEAGGTTPGEDKPGEDQPGEDQPGEDKPGETAGGCGGCGTIGFGGGFGGGIGLGILACAAILVVALRKKNAK